MYLQKIIIRNIKCFDHTTLDFSHPDGSPRLWNVIIGENGTGKTTILRAKASTSLAMTGRAAERTVQNDVHAVLAPTIGK